MSSDCAASCESQAWHRVIKLALPPGDDGVRLLRQALKLLLRRYKLRCVSISEANTSECDWPLMGAPIRACTHKRLMSAFGGKADIGRRRFDVRF